ncbi:hypothetical protein WN48_07977 [Eufriesea mexicana]|uniref:Uncharacterized protein n=1 Tax=Eufriesea mexicana TaxID=516756 RepID=A0A310STH9_9HYME|nr:hypothetical protein WN48_07977 [Eufriesea mexicana]
MANQFSMSEHATYHRGHARLHRDPAFVQLTAPLSAKCLRTWEINYSVKADRILLSALHGNREPRHPGNYCLVNRNKTRKKVNSRGERVFSDDPSSKLDRR